MASTAEALFRQKKAERNKQHSKESEKTAAPSKATPNASIKRSALQHDTSAIEQNKHAKRHEFDSKQQEVNERQFEAASLPNDFYQSTPEVSEQPQQGKQNEMEYALLSWKLQYGIARLFFFFENSIGSLNVIWTRDAVWRWSLV